MTKVTITFEVPDDMYRDYEEVYSNFDSDLQYIGIHEVEVKEEEQEETNDSILQSI